jgi:tetratricopeptide (TPR) repeat protein
MAVAPEQADAVLRVADEVAAAGDTDLAFHCAEIVVDDALLASDWERALDVLRSFQQHAPHIPALMKLVEIAVDAGHDEAMYEAQARLADAYLDAGRGAEARVIAEDLVAREPSSDVHVGRLRRALDLLGSSDADAIVRRYRDSVSASEGIVADAVQAPADAPLADEIDLFPPAPPALGREHAAATEQAASTADAVVIETLEIDLSDALAGLGATPASPPASREPAQPPQDLEATFEAMRTRAARDEQVATASERYERALQHLENGLVDQALPELQGAARAPQFRFRASARLGRLYIARGDVQQGIDWLERAAEAPPSSAEEGLSVLYDLAEVLEREGETARALAVLLEVDADRPDYRDVGERIEQLTRAQAGSRER